MSNRLRPILALLLAFGINAAETLGELPNVVGEEAIAEYVRVVEKTTKDNPKYDVFRSLVIKCAKLNEYEGQLLEWLRAEPSAERREIIRSIRNESKFADKAISQLETLEVVWLEDVPKSSMLKNHVLLHKASALHSLRFVVKRLELLRGQIDKPAYEESARNVVAICREIMAQYKYSVESK